MIEEGARFPEFSLQDQDGNVVTDAVLDGKTTVIYFYPKDDTPGCTKEACEFRDAMPQAAGAQVIGVSPDPVKSHRKFADKFSLPFTLLADSEHALAEACGVWVEKSMYGKKYMGIDRTTFLIGPDRVVKKVWRRVKPEGHATEVLAAVQA